MRYENSKIRLHSEFEISPRHIARLSQTTRIIKHSCGQHCSPSPAFPQPSLTLFCFVSSTHATVGSCLLSVPFSEVEASRKQRSLCFVHCCISSVQNTFLVCAAWVTDFPNGVSVWPLISGLTHPKVCEVRNRLPLVGWNSSLCSSGWGAPLPLGPESEFISILSCVSPQPIIPVPSSLFHCVM